jgi:hypothetical protein
MTMTDNDTHNPTKRSPTARVVLVATGAIAGLLAVALMGLGAFGLYGESQKDDRGYLNTGSERFEASTHALVTENLDLDLDGVHNVVSSPDLGKVRLDVSPQSGKPVFVGIARTDQVSSYLRGVAHTTVTDFDYEPFEASYTSQEGPRKPAAPADQTIWAASTQGAGSQTLTWDVEDGDWSVIVMNADGSPGVQVDVSAGAKVPYLTAIGWGVLGGGTGLLAVAIVLTVLGVRGPRQRSMEGKPAGGVVPIAG